jgi:hypothetical protein
LYEKWKKWKRTRNGLNDYIADELLRRDDDQFIEDQMGEEIDDECRWAAAKLAADAFLVDKFTLWEYLIDKENRFRLKPTPGWGGNPLRAILEPSFLPRRIKGMYKEEELYPEDVQVLRFLDTAFRPEYLLERETEIDGRVRVAIKKALPEPSMTIHLKKFARYNAALSTIVGSSRALGIPQWTKDTMGKDLPSAIELLDQVYGVADEPEGMKIKLGKQLMGVITSRILHCKALATALESSQPGFKDRVTLLFGKPVDRPFHEVLAFIFGPQLDYRRGFIDSLIGGRTKFIFRDNILGAEKEFKEIWELLATLDQDPETRGQTTLFYQLGFILDAAGILHETFGKKR